MISYMGETPVEATHRGNQQQLEANSVSYDIIPIRDLEKIKELLAADGNVIISQILLEMGGVVPTEISLVMVDDILDCLCSGSSEFNKLWVLNGEVVGFLVCTYLDDTELYLKYFGAKKVEGKKTPQALITGNIEKLLKSARKNSNIQTLSLHGFNKALNWLLMRRYGFKLNPEHNLSLQIESGLVDAPYLFLDLPEKKLDVRAETNISLTELKQALMERGISSTNAGLEIVLQKVLQYLRKTGRTYPPNGWQSLADVIAENYASLTDSSMGIATAIEKHQQNTVEIRRKLRAELAANPASPPELITTQGELTLFRLTTSQQLKQESLDMRHCVGDSDHYINRIIAGTAEIWSIRDTHDIPLLTIEYSPKKRRVLQMKKFDDALLTGQEEWFEDFLSILRALPALNPPIVIDECKDTNQIDFGNNKILTKSAEIVNFEDFIDYPIAQKSVLAGKVVPDSQTSKDELLKFSSISGLTLDCTDLTSAQKKLLTNVAGNIVDNSGDAQYSELKMIEGDLTITRDNSIFFPQLESVGGDIIADDLDLIDLPKINQIGGNLFAESALEIHLPQLVRIEEYFVASSARTLFLPLLEKCSGSFLVQSADSVDLPKLTELSGDFNCRMALDVNLPKILFIKGGFNCESAKNPYLPLLSEIKGDFEIDRATLVILPNITQIGKSFSARKATQVVAPILEIVGNNFIVENATRLELTRLKTIGGEFDARKALTINMPELIILGENLEANEATIINLPKLETAKGNILTRMASQITLPKLKQLDGCLLANSVTALDLPELEHCGSYFAVSLATTINLPLLKHIGGDLSANSVESLFLPFVEEINGSIYAEKTNHIVVPHIRAINGLFAANSAEVISMPNLERVSGYFSANSVLIADFPKLERCGGNIYLNSATRINIPFTNTLPDSLHAKNRVD